MATPNITPHVLLDGLVIGCLALKPNGQDAYDDFLGTGGMRGEDVTILGTGGVKSRARVRGAVRGLLTVRIDGTWTYDTDTAVTGDDNRIEEAYTTAGLLVAKADVVTVQDFSLVRSSGTTTVDCQVEDLEKVGQPSPWIWDYVLDLTLPAGTLL